MDKNATARELSAITDQGLFERLATAVLRESYPQYRLLTHPGVNVDGKTVKAPVDGITFISGAVPPHMIAVHHTTCARDDLQKKWLHDPAKVKPRKGGKPTAPAGDLIKTAQIFAEERKVTPDLRCTLILTTNQEPPDSLIRAVNAEGQKAALEIEVWSQSALAHFLDVDPTGQWIRRKFLGVEQERLSKELLRELSQLSLALNKPPDERKLWIERAFDQALARLPQRNMFFVVASSGLGKSIACYKRLTQHVERGGFGLILPHSILAESLSLDRAIENTLCQLHPSLAPATSSEWQPLLSSQGPFLIVIEDINKSGQPAVLIEKLIGWSKSQAGAMSASFQVLCPVWPTILNGLREDARKQVSALTISVPPLSLKEASAAVLRRREHAGLSITLLEAQSIAQALGNDPLLIALHDPGEEPEPDRVIERFIDSGLEKLASSRGEYTASEYKTGLREVAARMLENRCLDPTMIQVSDWLGAVPDTMKMLRHIVIFGEALHMAGSASNEHIAFRHDRVRDRLLVDAAADLIRHGKIPADVLGEPYFAEQIGEALVRCDAPADVVKQIRAKNPLALFYALRQFGEADSEPCQRVIAAAQAWLETEGTSGRENLNLRWEARIALAETDASFVIPLAQRFNEHADWWLDNACFRNGDILAGVRICARHEPGVGMLGHLEMIEYVRQRHRTSLINTLDRLLRDVAVAADHRIGALRLAGHLADTALADAIEASWRSDLSRKENLAAYLWAGAQCGGDDPARLLDPVCDAWAELPSKAENGHSASPRDDLAAHTVRWAFQKYIPDAAVRYFISRLTTSELRWPITYMLHGVDNPEAVASIAREMAAMDEYAEQVGGISPFSMTSKDEWRRRQDERDSPMSDTSRECLAALWKNTVNGKHIRKSALRLWSATVRDGDVAELAAISSSDILTDLGLGERLRRGDQKAIPLLIAKLQSDNNRHWWDFGRYIWSNALTRELDDELGRRGEKREQHLDLDWTISGLLMRLPVQTAETLLLKHWDHLRFSSYYVQTALYVATPSLVSEAASAVAASPNPKSLFEHLTTHFGYKTVGHPGITRLRQVETLAPYLDYLSDLDIHHLWELCNAHGWFDFRRRYIDSRLALDRRYLAYTSDQGTMAALDGMLEKEHPYWTDHWTDDYLKSGRSVDHLMSVVEQWLAQQTDVRALELAASIVVHAGNRQHPGILSSIGIEPCSEATAIQSNALFAVKRRSLT